MRIYVPDYKMGCCQSSESIESSSDITSRTLNQVHMYNSGNTSNQVQVYNSGRTVTQQNQEQEDTSVNDLALAVLLRMITASSGQDMVLKLARESGLGYDLVKKLHTLFFTVSGNGRMEPTEFIAMFVTIHDQVDNPYLIKFLARLYLVFDTDGSGYIVFQEFIAIMKIIINGNPSERLVTIFRLCDTDKSGTIEKAEFLSTLENLAAFIPGEVNITGVILMALANSAFNEMDMDGSGQVTLGEFIASLILCSEDDTLANLVSLMFQALVRIVTGDPPIPKYVKVLTITLT